MNPLELLKEKLRIKPIVEEHEKVYINIPIPENERVKLTNVTINDERGTYIGFNRMDLFNKMKEHKLIKTIIKPSASVLKINIEQEQPGDIIKKKTKKFVIKKKLVIEGDEKEKGDIEELEVEREKKKEVIEESTSKKRKTKPPAKGIVIIPPEEWVEFDNIETISRLPPKKPNVNIKVSSYFMNNREIFINFINSLFGTYRDEVMDNTTQISCDTIGSTSTTGEFSLLTHQKLVRDYLNLYTPYRGLLLYHGLGSGKTCTSIAIAEGFKSNKKIIVLTPASLRRNYIEELKKCGDYMYKKNQFWQWISIDEHPDAIETLSTILNLPTEYITKKRGAWLVNVTKPSNYDTLESREIKSLDDQIDEMIQDKYKFINYNGLRRNNLKDMTNNFETNIFDDAVIIIDEAHNFISRIANKITKEKEIAVDKTGKKDHIPISLALILYELLLNAKNARVILLTGTPIINYPNEIGILFNILRGYIKTWDIPINIQQGKSITKENIQEIFAREKSIDFIEYSKDKVLTITRNPFGFENKIKDGTKYTGVTNEKKKYKDKEGKLHIEERGIISDIDFERRIISILENNDISVNKSGIIINNQKALPDKPDDFNEMFINTDAIDTKNMELFKKRIIGLTSYFRSAQESLMPKYEKLTDFKVIKIPMSDYQFTIYEEARSQERKQEQNSAKNKSGVESSSTYRIFSRLYCNFAMPKPPGRPLPKEEFDEATKIEELTEILEKDINKINKEGEGEGENEEEIVGSWDGIVEGDEEMEKIADKTYGTRINHTIKYLKDHESTILSPNGLTMYSPKFLNMLENIADPNHIGLHLVYSQFRTLEGIGLFKMVLEANGFTQFKIKKNSIGVWDLDINEEDRGKPTFALYTGTESSEEKEMIRNIYNSDWDVKSGITTELLKIANNNHMGEIIKILMITASGSEGINLRSTRYVHIMEPYWNPARIEQIVGRARRICSHKALPEPLQTVEVFLYLMKFSEEQLKNDNSIELKRKDLSKKKYNVVVKTKQKQEHIPFTSDEALFEISTIKEEINSKIITAVKESSIDCAIYSKAGAKEQLNCMQFGEPSASSFSYIPNYKKEEPDNASKMNKRTIEWRGKPFEYHGKKYIYRSIDKIHGNLYDWDSYHRALENPQIDPVLIATTEKNSDGSVTIKKI